MRRFVLISIALAVVPVPAAAEVIAASDAGFAVHHETTVTASPDTAWAAFAEPARWWSGEHSYSGSAANMTLDPVAGGCFCEAIPAADGVPAGSVEHMRVVYADPRVRTLRLTGALGPLQAEALSGTLTMTVEPSGTGARIMWDYVVGGYARSSLKDFAPVVDGVSGEQFARLAALLDGGG